MKLEEQRSRISCLMHDGLRCLLLATILLAAATALGQRIERVSGSRFETELVVQELSDVPIENLSFKSSQYVGGTFSLRSADVQRPRLSYRKILKASSNTQAEEFIEYISVNVEELENELAISAETQSRPPWSGTDWSGRVELLVEVPANDDLKVYVRTSSYSIDVIGPFAAVDITNQMGAVSVSNVTRKVKIDAENSTVRVENCDGPVTVWTSLRPITLRNIDSRLGTIKLRNTNGRIGLEAIKGEIDARTDFAPVVASGLHLSQGRSKIRTENSNIKLDISEVSGDLLLINAHGKIDVTLPPTTSAQYSLQVDEGGRIYTSGIPIQTEAVKRTLLSGFSGEKKHKITIDMRGVGTITLSGVP